MAPDTCSQKMLGSPVQPRGSVVMGCVGLLWGFCYEQ